MFSLLFAKDKIYSNEYTDPVNVEVWLGFSDRAELAVVRLLRLKVPKARKLELKKNTTVKFSVSEQSHESFLVDFFEGSCKISYLFN